MKSKGIKFTILTEDEAKVYLEHNTYYFKIKEYAKLFDKFSNPAFPEKIGKYVNLEFAYLKDLATIDSYIRKIILRMSIDIEHYLKVKLISDFNKTNEDGYTIVKDFLSCNPKHYEEEWNAKLHGTPCSHLVEKYKDGFAIWNIIEVLSFGDFREFFKFFYLKYAPVLYGKSHSPYDYLINPVRILRNASAHNNCLISSLAHPYVSPEKMNTNYEINRLLGNNHFKGKTTATNLSKPLIHDFCVLLYLYYKVAPQEVQIYTFSELFTLFIKRIPKHKEFYQNNATLLSAYNFTRDVITFFNKLAETPEKNS